MLQRFVFTKVCMGENAFEFIAKYNDILTIKSTSSMSCRYVCCYLASQADPRRFKRVMPFWVSTAKCNPIKLTVNATTNQKQARTFLHD